jgi:hypothetical protein
MPAHKLVKARPEVDPELSDELERALLAAEVALSGLRDATLAIANAARSMEAVREICHPGLGESTRRGRRTPEQADLLWAEPVPRAD